MASAGRCSYAGALGVIAVCLWWLWRCCCSGAVSPPFLDWIESASTTTLSTSLGEVLRGTSHWVAYVADGKGPFWQGGWLLVTNPAFVLNTLLLAGLGLAGLASRRLPERRWLALSVLVGVVLVTFGHDGPLAPPWAEAARDLLDGPLAPLRNLHKFDPLLRVPLALASAHAALLAVRWMTGAPGPGAPYLAALLAGVLLAGSGAPLLLGKTAPQGAFEDLPGYWHEVADYLAFRGDGAAAVVPGASFGVYYWGNTRDEPLQPLADSAVDRARRHPAGAGRDDSPARRHPVPTRAGRGAARAAGPRSSGPACAIWSSAMTWTTPRVARCARCSSTRPSTRPRATAARDLRRRDRRRPSPGPAGRRGPRSRLPAVELSSWPIRCPRAGWVPISD